MIIHISTHILLRKAIALFTSGPEGMLVPHAHKAWHFYKTLKHVLSHNTTIPVFLVSQFADLSFFVAAHFYKYLSVKTVLLITESSLFKVKMKRICLLSLQREYFLVLDAFLETMEIQSGFTNLSVGLSASFASLIVGLL